MVRKHQIKEEIPSNFVLLLLVFLYEEKLFTELTSNYFFLKAGKYSIHCYSAQGGSGYDNGTNQKNDGKEGPNKGWYNGGRSGGEDAGFDDASGGGGSASDVLYGSTMDKRIIVAAGGSGGAAKAEERQVVTKMEDTEIVKVNPGF